MAGLRVDVHSFPSDDDDFGAYVEQCIRGMPNGSMDARTLAVHLRRRFPHATVRPQTDLAQEDGVWIWYVYRDGHAEV